MIIIDKTSTELLAHTISGDYDSYDGWKKALTTGESVDSCIISGREAGEDGLVWFDIKKFAEDVLTCCNRRGKYVADTYVTGQTDVDTCKDDRLLAYIDHVKLCDITPNSCYADIEYKVTVVFSHEQEDYAKDDDGYVVSEDLDWDSPYMIVIEEM